MSYFTFFYHFITYILYDIKILNLVTVKCCYNIIMVIKSYLTLIRIPIKVKTTSFTPDENFLNSITQKYFHL